MAGLGGTGFPDGETDAGAFAGQFNWVARRILKDNRTGRAAEDEFSVAQGEGKVGPGGNGGAVVADDRGCGCGVLGLVEIEPDNLLGGRSRAERSPFQACGRGQTSAEEDGEAGAVERA